MKVDFVRFKAADSVELQGWLSDIEGDTAVIHIHGMSGNGYENQFLDPLRTLFVKQGISFFTINTRGHGIISYFPKNDSSIKGGSCFEIFEESLHDIKGAIGYLRSLGKTKFILQGHSLGCTKVVHYMVSQNPDDVVKVILIAPTDMTRWAGAQDHHEIFLERANMLLKEGKGEELVDAQCWWDKTPISAQTYPTICEADTTADIYGEREGGAFLGRIGQPVLIPYGTNDVGIEMGDGTMENWLERVNIIKNRNTRLAIINGADHGFRGHEKELTAAVESFIN